MRRTDIEKKVQKKYRAPKPDRVLILLDEIPSESKTPSGLIVPLSVARRKQQARVGTVISCGSDITLVEEGDRILIKHVFGSILTHEDEMVCPLKIVSEDQIDAVLTGDAERKDYDLEKDGLSL